MEPSDMGASLLHLAQFASTAPAQILIASLWQGLLLTAMAWLGLRIAPAFGLKLAPGTRFTLWMIVFIIAAVLPLSALVHEGPLAPASSHASALLSTAHVSVVWAVTMVGLWALASLFSMTRLLLSIHRLYMLSRTSTPIPSEELSGELRSLLAKPASRPIEICLSEEIDGPLVIGFFRSAIVIPRWLWVKLTPSELHQIVVHELAHLGRRDDWTNLLQKFFRALFPLNPALLLAERQLCWEREMACDDAVLDASISPKEYATCLTSLAEKRLLRRAQLLAPGAWRRRSELAGRVHRILKSKGALRPLRSRPVVAAFVAAYLCAGLALARCPQFIAFTNPVSQTARPALEARAQFPDRSPSVIPAAMRMDGRNLDSARLVDAGFRTVVPAVHPIHRRAAKSNKTTIAKQRLLRRRMEQSHLTQSHLVQARYIEAQFAAPLFAQAEDQSGKQPAATEQGNELILSVWVLPSLPAVDGGDLSYPRFTGFSSHSSWIVIQI